MLRKICFLLACCFFAVAPAKSWAISVIRDSETEGVVLSYIRRIFKAAGLNPSNAQVVLVNDPSLNAFVAGGQTIFIHTGLIVQSKVVDDLIFVLAHETGHIVGGHITRGIGAYGKAKTTALISTILGGLVAAAGRPDAGIAVMMGGSSSAVGLFTSYRQSEESAADRTAVDILKKTNYSLVGFENTMKTIRAQERLTAAESDSYLRTHPMTQDRMKALERFAQHKLPAHDDIRFELIRAKLIAFLSDPRETMERFRGQTGMAADYARAIAAYRAHRFDEAQRLLDALIAQKPDYPYFYELKGQFYLETGQIEPAIVFYEKAAQLLPKAPLVRLSLAQALMQHPNRQRAEEAITHLNYVLSRENDTPYAWQLLASAYEQTGRQKEITYVMAEYYRSEGDLKRAKRMAQKALDTLPENTVAYLKAQDILNLPDKPIAGF